MLRRALLATSLLAACRAEAPSTPAASSAEACGSCHCAEYTEWAGSWHRRAFLDADFQSSYRVDRFQFCVDCHAPRSQREGIGCVDCHDTPSAHGRNASAHATTRSCRGCHDFAVPGRPDVPLQSTWTEHEASPYAAVACTSCHRGHELAGARDAASVRRALRWRARRVAAAQVEIALETVGVGHRFPTGDLYRRLRAEVIVEDAGGTLVGYAERSFRRDWDEHHASLRFRRAESYADDTRIDVRSIFTVESSAPAHHVRLVLTYDRGRFGAGEELQTFEEMAVVDELVPLEP